MNSSKRPSGLALGSNLKGLVAHRRAAGFTLIELLTVIAIIGILAAIIIPTVGAVRRSAYKAQCASNMHQLGMAVNLHRADNRNRLPDGHGIDGVGSDNSADLQRIGANLRDLLIGKPSEAKSGYGLTWGMLFCPGNKAYTDRWMIEENRVTTGTNIPIGYLYLPGTSVTVATSKGASTSIYKRLAEPLGYRLIAADINRKFEGNWGGGVNHSNDDNLLGGNHLYVDGSVKWIEGQAFSQTPALSSGGSQYYFKTEDIR